MLIVKYRNLIVHSLSGKVVEVTETEGKEFSKYLVPNMATNVVRTVLTALIGLMLVPFFIDELGRGVYGILPLATSVTTYVIVISDELTNAFSRSLIIALHGNDMAEANKVYTTTVLGLGKIVLLLFPLVVIISYVSPSIFQIGPSSAGGVQLLFLMALSSALLISFSACFNGIYMAFNRMYILYIARIAQILLQVVLILALFFVNGASLEMVGAAYVISSIVFFAIVWTTSKRLCPHLHIDRPHYDRALLKEMSTLGLWTITSRLGLLMFIQASLVIVNILLGTEEEAGFAIVANLISMTNTTCMTITTVIAPFLYRSYAENNMENIIKIAKSSMRFIGLFIAFPIAYLCIFSPQILTVWVGGEFSYLSDIVIVMFLIQVAVCAINVLETIPILLVKMRKIAFLTLTVGAANIIFALIAVEFAGMETMGVAVVWMLSMFVLNVLLYPYAITKMTSSPCTTFLRPMIPGYIAFFICLALCWVSTKFYTMPSTWTAVLGLFLLMFVIYIVIAMVLGLKRVDKDMMRSVMPEPIAKLIPRWLL